MIDRPRSNTLSDSLEQTLSDIEFEHFLRRVLSVMSIATKAVLTHIQNCLPSGPVTSQKVASYVVYVQAHH